MNDYQRRIYVDARKAYAAFILCYPFGLENLQGEEWVPVPDYENYHVSNFGRTKSFYNDQVKILKPALNRQYLFVYLYKDGKGQNFRVHRLVAQLFVPNPSNKPQVNHIDGNKLNNHVSNLEWVTNSENMRHAVDTGLQKVGEDCPDAKLTVEQVLYIRANPESLTCRQLAKLFSVDPMSISLIQRGKNWKQAGGIIRGKKQGGLPKVSDNIRDQIRAEYVFGSAEFGSYGLAKKYGVSQSTILNIVRES